MVSHDALRSHVFETLRFIRREGGREGEREKGGGWGGDRENTGKTGAASLTHTAPGGLLAIVATGNAHLFQEARMVFGEGGHMLMVSISVGNLLHFLGKGLHVASKVDQCGQNQLHIIAYLVCVCVCLRCTSACSALALLGLLLVRILHHGFNIKTRVCS